MFERSELQLIKKRANEPRRFIQVISGPRQVGKTTLINQLLEQISMPAKYEAADDVPAGNNVWIDQVWEAARLKMKAEKSRQFLLVIDEIQKIRNWSESVKKNWDYDTNNKINLKVILLGSSRLLLQQGLTESLAGRFENIIVGHWTFTEMHKAFGWDAETYAWFGGYPGSAPLIDDEGRWKSYIRDSLVETSISKDILMLTRIDKPALLKNLFELGSLYSGQVLSFTKMLGQLHDAGNTTTLSHYLGLLASAGLITGLDKYSGSPVKIRSGSPKFQVYNNALLAAQGSKDFRTIKNDPVQWGRIVESAVGAYLANEAMKGRFSLYYWRERNDEVDFIIERGTSLTAIEVKSTFTHHTKGLASFIKKFPGAKAVTIADNTLPWYEFLRIDPLELF
ncbi:MAG: ATP-binding protein [Bacteroidales bacterium]|nr:ATP-binding protein [Bacteroidales bacterium]